MPLRPSFSQTGLCARLRLCRLAAAACFLLLPLSAAWAVYDLPALENVEKQVEAVAKKSMPSVVALTHSVGGGKAAQGSGTILTPSGLILTAAHVVSDEPTVIVTFYDGKSTRGKVLGADYDNDVALVQITEPGNYPSVELGDTKSLAVGQLVVAMGNPGGFDYLRKPPVRFGRVFAFDHGRYIQSDCVLVGGDSGGPLFDLDGKVIGVHSSIGADMDENNDAPAEIVRKDWDRLMKGERWGRNPMKTGAHPFGVRRNPSTMGDAELAGLNLRQFQDRVLQYAMKNGGHLEARPTQVAQWLRDCGMKKERVASMSEPDLIAFMAKALSSLDGVKVVPEISQSGEGGPNPLNEMMRKALGAAASRGKAGEIPPDVETIMKQDKEVLDAVRPALDKLAPSVVSLLDGRDGKKALVLGTIVRANGFILTKHSEIAKAKGALHVRLADGRDFPAVEVQRFEDHDLALVKVAADALPAVTLPQSRDPLPLGKLLFSPGNTAAQPMLAMGVVSVADRSLMDNGGFLGIAMGDGKDAVDVTEVTIGSPAARAGLQKSDQILSIDGEACHSPQDLKQHIRALKPGTKIAVKYRRGEEEKSADIMLTSRPRYAGSNARTNPMAALGTQVSDQHGGYPVVFQHDQPLSPDKCGSIVTDLHGEIAGINIARAGRVNTYAIPVGIVADLLKGVDFDALGKSATSSKN